MAETRKLAVCSFSRFYMKLSFLWPTNKEEINHSKWFYIRLFIFLVVSTLTFTFLVFMHLLKCLEEGNVDVSEDLAILAALFGYKSIMVLYVFKQRKLQTLMWKLSDFTKLGKPPHFDEVNRRFDYWAKFIFYYGIISTLIYNTRTIVQIPQCKRERKIQEICGPLVPLWIPFDIASDLIFSLVTLYSLTIALIIDKIVLLVSLQVLEISWNIKLRIDQLKSMILECFDEGKFENRRRLNMCIRYHLDIIDYSKRLNDCFTNEMFIHLTTTGIICGCLENQIVKGYNFGTVLHILAWIGALAVSCFGGQMLMDSSLSVADVMYCSKWYEADVHLRKYAILMMVRSQKPLYVTTGSFGVLTLPLFVSIMKMSYSFFTLLN